MLQSTSFSLAEFSHSLGRERRVGGGRPDAEVDSNEMIGC